MHVLLLLRWAVFACQWVCTRLAGVELWKITYSIYFLGTCSYNMCCSGSGDWRFSLGIWAFYAAVSFHLFEGCVVRPLPACMYVLHMTTRKLSFKTMNIPPHPGVFAFLSWCEHALVGGPSPPTTAYDASNVLHYLLPSAKA